MKIFESKSNKKKIAICIAFIIGIGMVSLRARAGQQRDVSVQIVSVQNDMKQYEYQRYQTMVAALEAEILSSDALEARDEKWERLHSYRLQMDMDAYYVDNRDKIIADKETKNEYECYNCKIHIMQNAAQLEYLKVLQSELEKELEIEKRRLELGYSIQLDVDAIQSQLEETALGMEEIELDIDFQKQVLKSYGEENLDISVPDALQPVGKDYVEEFIENSIQIKYYDQQAVAYENYMNDMEGSHDGMEEVELQLQLSRLNKQQYQLSLERYVQEKKKSYEQARLKVQEYDSKIKIVEKRIENSELLYEKGRIREVDILELKTEKAQLEYERVCNVGNALLSLYILEHNIEN